MKKHLVTRYCLPFVMLFTFLGFAPALTSQETTPTATRTQTASEAELIRTRNELKIKNDEHTALMTRLRDEGKITGSDADLERAREEVPELKALQNDIHVLEDKEKALKAKVKAEKAAPPPEVQEDAGSEEGVAISFMMILVGVGVIVVATIIIIVFLMKSSNERGAKEA